MLVLLPPSEGKSAPQEGDPVDLTTLAYPELEKPRASLLRALTKLCAGSPKRARAVLELSEGQAADALPRNAALLEAPAAPAAEVYTGVLYEHLRLNDLPPDARERAERHVLIASALWGVVRPGDRIPAYRLSMAPKLPRITGGLAAYWRPHLRKVLPDPTPPTLVIDARSGGYVAAWKPRAATHLAVRAFTEAPDGSRKVVSHMAKAARGDVARALLLAPQVPATPEDAAAAVEAAGLRVELGPGVLDVIVAG